MASLVITFQFIAIITAVVLLLTCFAGAIRYQAEHSGSAGQNKSVDESAEEIAGVLLSAR
jgi:hypothetical protein